MKAALMIISMLSCLMAGAGNKEYTLNQSVKQNEILFFNMATGAVATAVLWLWGGVKTISSFSLWLGLAFGIVTMLQQFFTLRAIQIGPMAYTSVIVSLSTIIPAISGAIIWHEQIKPLQIIGVLLLLICFLLSVQPNAEDKQSSIRWLIYSLAAFLCTGAVGVLQKWHQLSEYRSELSSFLVISFFVYTVIALLILLIKRKRGVRINACIMTWKNFLLVLTVGIGCAVNNKLNLYLSGVIDSMIFFPLVNGGNIILTTVLSFVLFHEKLSKRQCVGILVGTIAVVLLVI